MTEAPTITLQVHVRRFGNVAFLAGGLLAALGMERIGGWIAMLGLRVEVA